jgi:hypothetical protein
MSGTAGQGIVDSGTGRRINRTYAERKWNESTPFSEVSRNSESLRKDGPHAEDAEEAEEGKRGERIKRRG